MIARTLIATGLLALASTGCGSDSGGADPAAAVITEVGPVGLRTVTPAEAAATLADAPDDLVVLDVRTPEEFADGHLPGATMLDFYRTDFAEQLATLDRDVPYVLYCRSGNRSGQALEMMESLGFTSVQEVAGGVLSWTDAGLELQTP